MRISQPRAWMPCAIAPLFALSFAFASPVAAQETEAEAPPPTAAEAPPMSAEQQAMMEAWQKAATPGPQHAQLAEHFAGTWNTKQTMWMDPSAPPMTATGTSVNTPVLGGRQIHIVFTSEFMGQPFHGIGYTGYDNVRDKYTSIWVDNMSTGVMAAEGGYDPATKTYDFRGEMVDPMNPGTSVPIRETIRIVDADHHAMEMYETRDGKEVRTMLIEYTRAK